MWKNRKKKGMILAVIVGIIGVLLFVYGNLKKNTPNSESTSVFSGKYIISAQEAKEKIGQEDVVFLDARGTVKALLGTVKGAAVTDWQSLTTCESGNPGDEEWGLIPEPEDLTERLRKLGIDKEKEVIVLGQPEDGWGEDGRVLWELLQAGCKNVKMVDGGITALKNSGVSMKFGGSNVEPSDISVQKIDPSNDITTEELMENYDEFKIVDVRTQEEYDGAILHGEAQGGHLPGAVLVPYQEIFTEDTMLKTKEEITELFEAKGIHKEDQIVTYCTGGIRSAYVQLVLEMCGFENVRSYGQSFWRWAVVGEVEK